MTSVLADEYVVARKSHFCGGCLGVIGKGDLYHRQRIASGRDAWTWKAHTLCSHIVVGIGEDWGDGIEADPDEVREVLGESARTRRAGSMTPDSPAEQTVPPTPNFSDGRAGRMKGVMETFCDFGTDTPDSPAGFTERGTEQGSEE